MLSNDNLPLQLWKEIPDFPYGSCSRCTSWNLKLFNSAFAIEIVHGGPLDSQNRPPREIGACVGISGMSWNFKMAQLIVSVHELVQNYIDTADDRSLAIEISDELLQLFHP